MSAEAHLKSQGVAWLAETNQTLAMKNQREDQFARQQQHLRSENLINHLLVESKSNKKRDLTDLLIEKKIFLE